MDVTIVIPSYKSERTIEKCLESLLNQDTKFIYEVILVDSSPDNKVDNIVNKFPRVKFIKLGTKTYPGIVRNIGAKGVLGELLLFVDADIIAPGSWLENVFSYYKKGHNVFSGSLDMWKGKGVGILEKIDWFFESSDYKPSMKEGIRWCLPAVALAIKKELFHNEKFLDMETSEDVELTVRLRNKGNTLYFNPGTFTPILSVLSIHITGLKYSNSLRTLGQDFSHKSQSVQKSISSCGVKSSSTLVNIVPNNVLGPNSGDNAR